MKSTLVCEINKDGVVVRSCNNISTTEVEYTNKNKMVEQDGYICLRGSVFTVRYSPYRVGLITFLPDLFVRVDICRSSVALY